MIYPEQSTLSLDDLMEQKVGVGKYQIITLAILVLIDLNDGCELILMSFLMPILKKEWQLTSLQVQVLTSVFYLGMVFGSLLTGVVADKKGRKNCIIFGCFSQFIVSNMFAFCNSPTSMVFVRFFYGFVFGFTIPLTTCMISEITTMAFRGRFLIIINFFVSLGKIYAFILAYICLEDFHSGHWRLMMILSSFSALLVAILTILFMLESPRFMMASNQIDEGLNIVEEIIHINQSTPPWIHSYFLTSFPKKEKDPFPGSKYGYISKSEKHEIEKWIRRVFKNEKRGNLLELFNTSNINTTVRLWTMWFFLNYMYFGQLIILPFIYGQKNQSFFDYLSAVAGEVPSILVSLYLIEVPHFGRKNTMALSFLCASIFHLLSYSYSWPIFLTRFFMKECYAMLYPFSTECYQTSNRTLGFGSASAVGRIASTLSPYILIPLFEYNLGLPFISFGIGSIICFGACITLPFDTRGRVLDAKNEEIELNRFDQAEEILSQMLENQNN